jgi:hypothetical protein
VFVCRVQIVSKYEFKIIQVNFNMINLIRRVKLLNLSMLIL